MKEMPDRMEKQESRRAALRKVGRFVLPTLVTFQLSALKVQASDRFGMPRSAPNFSRS